MIGFEYSRPISGATSSGGPVPAGSVGNGVGVGVPVGKGVGVGVPVGKSSRIPPQATISEITANGSGIITFDFLTDPTTYTVESNGLIRIELQGGQFYDGIVSQNGDIFTFVDTQDSGDDFIEMGVAIKKTQ